GEVILLGENLPHKWHCEEKYYKKNLCSEVEAIVIHFLPNCFGNDFLLLPETHFLHQLFEKARYGMVILGETREKLIKLMIESTKAQNLNRILILLSMLDLLSESSDYKFINTTYKF